MDSWFSCASKSVGYVVSISLISRSSLSYCRFFSVVMLPSGFFVGGLGLSNIGGSNEKPIEEPSSSLARCLSQSLSRPFLAENLFV